MKRETLALSLLATAFKTISYLKKDGIRHGSGTAVCQVVVFSCQKRENILGLFHARHLLSKWNFNYNSRKAVKKSNEKFVENFRKHVILFGTILSEAGDILYQFRDPIHGFIDVTEDEKRIIDSAPFQRLRRIKQLGTSYLVYHGAEHTRFGHSLGVMQLVSRVFDTITSKQKALFEEPKRFWYRQILRLIALTHDLGHPPFSHASESLFVKGCEHEDMTRKILIETEISEYIRIIGKKLADKCGQQYMITPELLWLIYDGKDVLNEQYIMPDFKFLQSFMDGDLDCDKMDYLLRDSYYCGVQYGRYDLDRLISSFDIYQKEEGNILLLALERGGIHAMEEFVLARYFMFIQVYLHKTRRYLDKKLSDCLEKLLPCGKYPTAVNEYMLWDDNKVLALIQQNRDKNIYAKDFADRKILSCVYQSPVHPDKSGNPLFRLYCRTIEEKILAELIDKSELPMYYCVDEKVQKVHKIPESLNNPDEKGVSLPIIMKSGKPSTVYDESLLLSSLKSPITINRIYVHDKFKHIAESVINF